MRMVKFQLCRLYNEQKPDNLEKQQADPVAYLLDIIEKLCFDVSAVTTKPSRGTVDRRNMEATRRALAQLERVVSPFGKSDADVAEMTVTRGDATVIPESVRAKV